MACRTFISGQEIRHRISVGNGLAVGETFFQPVGNIQLPEGIQGGSIIVSSPNAWMTWRLRTVHNHVPIETFVRTGPASWDSFRVTGSCEIAYVCPLVEIAAVNQVTGLRIVGPAPPPADIQGNFWYEPDMKSALMPSVFPVSGDLVPPADVPPLPATSTRIVGYCPRFTRYAMVSSPDRLNIQASYPVSANMIGQKLLNGPNDGDLTFYLGQWAGLRLENLGLVAVPFKVVWTDSPGGNDN